MAEQDGSVEDLMLTEAPGVLSIAWATQKAEWACGLRGKTES